MTNGVGTSRIFFAVTALVVAFGTIPSHSRLSAQRSDALSPQVAAQIDALMAEKASRTPSQRKMDSQLVYAAKMARGEPIASGVATLRVTLADVNERGIVLDVRADVSDGLLNQLRALGADVLDVSATYRNIRIRVGMGRIEAIAALPDVTYVQPKQEAFTSRTGTVGRQPLLGAPVNIRELRVRKRIERADVITSVRRAVEGGGIVLSVGSSSSEGDATHRAALARSTYGVSGAGVKIGVISDGVTNLAASQASGNLGQVTVLTGQAGSGDEGTAMLEIVHDLAPGAELYFATAINSLAGFAQNIRNLQAAGCTIVVDDVGYSVESPFQDGQVGTSPTNGGIVAQAVKDVAAAGVLYFSSAANSGNKNDNTSGTWEGDFVDGGPPTGPLAGIAGRVHDFGGQTYNQFVNNNPNRLVTLFWSDPLGASANDYDLYILNSAGTSIAISSTNFQNGTQDPYEDVLGSFAGERAVIVKFSGSARFLHLDTGRNRLQISTPGSTHGHAATSAPNSFGVAATPAAAPFSAGQMPGPYPGAFNASNTIESFSSDGPRRIFFTGNGSPLTPGNLSSTGGQVLQKPDFTAADGVSVSGAGGFPTTFYGTSAAAPHAAAIAALVKSRNLAQTATQVRTALFSSAVDIEGAGIDRDSGVGIIMADTAVAAVSIDVGPTITAQPANQTVTVGSNASFTVAASGNPAPTVQWQVSTNGGATFGNLTNTAPYSGVTTATLAISSTALSLNGAQYRAVATNSVGSATSNPATLTVTVPIVGPTITAQPANQTVTAGASASFTVAASGNPAPTVQWQVSTSVGSAFFDLANSAPYSGVTTTTLTISSSSLSFSGTQYRAVATNSVGSATSNPATLTVNAAPTITQQPASQTVTAGSNVSFIAAASGSPAPTFQWQVSTNGGTFSDLANSAPYSGVTTATLTVTAVTPSLTRSQFRAVATNVIGSATSNAATVMVRTVVVDADGDGRTDLGIFRPSTATWFIRNSTTDYATSSVRQWGLTGDVPVPGDYDGDGQMDLAVYRPSTAGWYIRQSSTDSMATFTLGRSRDLPVPGDYDGDGRTDLAVYHRSTGVWSLLTSGTNYATTITFQWGLSSDIPVPGDYDGDGRTDLAVYRPSTGAWYVLTSSSGSTTSFSQPWGVSGDVPVPGDYDGDSITDFALYRPATGEWHILQSTMNFTTSLSFQWGLSSDLPVPGDYDGDGRIDLAVYRPTTGTWFIRQSSTGFSTSAAYQWGLSSDIPVPNAPIAHAMAASGGAPLATLLRASDFDGDGKSDITVYRPSSGTWFSLRSSTSYATSTSFTLGVSSDLTVTGDFDGDGQTDAGVFTPATGIWSIVRSSLGATTYQWGLAGDVPVPGDYDGDGKTDLAVYRGASGTWFIRQSSSNFTTSVAFQWGLSDDVTVPGDYDGDGMTDLAVWRPSTGTWFIRLSGTAYAASVSFQWGLAGDITVPGDYDGDGQTDLTVFRPSTGTWFIRQSSTDYTTSQAFQWGLGDDIPAPGDFDGDGKTDLAIFRPSSGTWFLLKSSTSFTTSASIPWGLIGDIPIVKRP